MRNASFFVHCTVSVLLPVTALLSVDCVAKVMLAAAIVQLLMTVTFALKGTPAAAVIALPQAGAGESAAYDAYCSVASVAAKACV